MRKSTITKLAVVIVLSITVGLVGYFTLWRAPDSEYAALSQQLSILAKQQSIITTNIQAATSPAGISSNTIANLKQASTSYNDSLKPIKTNAALSRDSNIEKIYKSHSDTIEKYGNYGLALANSLGLYDEILSACGDLSTQVASLKSVNSFTVASRECSTAIENAKSSQNNDFNSQFFTTYQEKSQALLSAYKANIPSTVASQAAVDDAIAHIIQLGDITIKYTVVDPATVIKELKTQSDSRKALLIR